MPGDLALMSLMEGILLRTPYHLKAKLELEKAFGQARKLKIPPCSQSCLEAPDRPLPNSTR